MVAGRSSDTGLSSNWSITGQRILRYDKNILGKLENQTDIRQWLIETSEDFVEQEKYQNKNNLWWHLQSANFTSWLSEPMLQLVGEHFSALPGLVWGEMTLTFWPDHDVQSYEISQWGTAWFCSSVWGVNQMKRKVSWFHFINNSLECVYFISGFRKAAFVYFKITFPL